MTETTVDKVIFENKTAKAVKCLINGVPEEIRCAKEVLLCGGAYGSPTLLQRSGVGNRAFLESKEIECIHELNGVGENLQDHIDYITSHRVDSWSLMGSQSIKFILRAPFEVLRYILTRTGMFSSPIAEGGAFLKTSEDLEAPDIQLHFAIGMIEDHGRKKHQAMDLAVMYVCCDLNQSALLELLPKILLKILRSIHSFCRIEKICQQ